MGGYMNKAKTCVWETPKELFDELNMVFHFTLDPCALPENAKCEKFFTPEDDGLSQNWGGHRVFCNPPYGREIADWVKKAYEESEKPDTLVVMLLPVRTDTAWFHDYVLGNADIHFLRGRLRFGGAKDPAPFPSMLVYFGFDISA